MARRNHPGSEPVVWLSSLAGPGSVGGLAAYARALGRELADGGGKVFHLKTAGGVSPLPDCRDPIETTVCAAGRTGPGILLGPLGPRLASRPVAHGLLQWIAEQGFRVRVRDGIPALPTVVHFIGTGWDLAGFAFLRMARKSGALFTVLPAVHPRSWGDDAIDLRLYRQADAVFCLSDHERHHLAGLGVPPRKLVKTVLPPNCPRDGDGSRFRELHRIGERPMALFIGRRDAGKGYPALLQAWGEVVRQVPGAVLCLAGPGGAEYTAARDALPPDSYRDLGVPDETGKADALAACDLFCLPSAHESFGIVYVEAWSYGKPVVCGTAPASRELVDPTAGVWTDGTPGAIAASIQSILRDPGRGQEMGRRGQVLQRNHYHPREMIRTHLAAWGMTEEPREPSSPISGALRGRIPATEPGNT